MASDVWFRFRLMLGFISTHFSKEKLLEPLVWDNYAIYLRRPILDLNHVGAISSTPCCDKFDKQITFVTNIRKILRFNYSSEEHWVANLWKFLFASPSSVHSYSLRVESIRGDLPRIEDLPRFFREKLCLEKKEKWRRSRQSCQDSWERKLPVLQLLSFIFFQPSKLDDETWSKVAERMQDPPIIFRIYLFQDRIF